MLQKISISNKCCSFDLSSHERMTTIKQHSHFLNIDIYKKYFVSTKSHIKIISENPNILKGSVL